MNKKYEYWKDDVALYKQLRIKPSIAWPTILLFIRPLAKVAEGLTITHTSITG